MDPDQRMQERLSKVEGKPEPWRSGQTSDSGPRRMICGTINTGGAGSIVTGGGFTINRTGVGNITVTWVTPFPGIPVVVSSPAVPGALGVWNNVGGSLTVCTFGTYVSNTGAGVDTTFSFIAYGPVQ
jgi:hypothetical protein